jgi:hypothetical protein
MNSNPLRDRLEANPYIGITLSFKTGAIVINIRNQRMEQERHTAQTLDEAFDIIKVSAVTARLKGV